jgi:outer membrane protein OmpA-like peptidoglycan-associated protein
MWMRRREAHPVRRARKLGRLGGILALAALLGTGCASGSGSAERDSAAPVLGSSFPETVPFTDRELADQLRGQGIRGATTGQTGGNAPDGEPLPEISETPRGIVITLPHAHFGFDNYDLEPQARRVVERVAHVLNHPRAMGRLVLLEGHADAIGTKAYNLALSRRRAETVARELITQGVQRERITIEAYGASRPIAPNKNPDGTDNPAGRAKNRRVEAVIRN